MGEILELKPLKIGVLRALQLGDLLCAVPAVRALKSAFPESSLTLIGMPWAESFSQRFNHYFSKFISFPGIPGLPEQEFKYREFCSFLREINQQNFDLIIQMHGNGTIINPVLGMFGAKAYAGYTLENYFYPVPGYFMRYPDEGSEVSRHLKLMEYLGVPSKGSFLEFPVSQEETNQFFNLLEDNNLSPGSYVCIHAGARDKKRWWHPERFAMVADAIYALGYKIVLTGTEAERLAVEKVRTLIKSPVVSLVGKTGLGTLAALIKDAAMVLSNDTGVSHIAAAVRTPSVIIFLTSDPDRWSPLNKNLHKCILPDRVDDMDFVMANVEVMLSDSKRNLEEINVLD